MANTNNIAICGSIAFNFSVLKKSILLLCVCVFFLARLLKLIRIVALDIAKYHIVIWIIVFGIVYVFRSRLHVDLYDAHSPISETRVSSEWNTEQFHLNVFVCERVFAQYCWYYIQFWPSSYIANNNDFCVIARKKREETKKHYFTEFWLGCDRWLKKRKQQQKKNINFFSIQSNTTAFFFHSILANNNSSRTKAAW